MNDNCYMPPDDMELTTGDDVLDFYRVSIPIDGWATADLVTVSIAIDAELQQRADEMGANDAN